MSVSDHDIEQCLLDLLRHRAETSSICPSDVARTLAGDEGAWREAMPAVRQVAARLARAGIVVITQGDAVVPPARIDHGPIRLRRGPKFS
ncbi:DUF3253 domain-containing protein [Bordetella sp. LUAb4]|uniref:DUF3253 domain-containing protein n=1 Tax=Bordetella sp. LUAb4 TaxID=2843195 RepID=UPI001E4A9A57|nr:DUF3253 domain-containing protein [Bordetella sp. LUAb4]